MTCVCVCVCVYYILYVASKQLVRIYNYIQMCSLHQTMLRTSVKLAG